MGAKRMKRNFLKDDKARIPFSVIGVFLIIGSSVTASYIGSFEQQKSKEICLSLDFSEIEQVLRYVEADISRSLGYSGSEALKFVGNNVVISSTYPSDISEDYGDMDNDDVPDLDMSGDKLDDSVLFNINWIRNIIRCKLNEYIESNFMEGKCNYLDYIVNVLPDSKTGQPISDWRNVTYKKINMELNRNCGGVDDFFVTEKSKNYETYWEFSVPITLNILDTKTEQSRNFKINPNCIITSRLPIMYRLTNTFVETINGDSDIFANKLAVFIGLTGAAYTEARALMMWSQGPSKIKNIVDNEWVKYLTNTGLVLEEFMVFNSVDPMSLIDLATKVGDFTGTKTEGLESSDCLSVDFGLDNIQNDLKQGILDDINTDPLSPEYDESDVEELLKEAESKIDDNNMIKSVQHIAEEILYDVECRYYYHRVNSNNEPVDSSYNPCPPKNAHTITLSEKKYKKKGTSYTDPDNSAYKFILGKADADGQEDVVKRNVQKNKINFEIKNEAEKNLKNNYKCYISTDVDRKNHENLGYVGDWSPDYSHGDELLEKGSWIFYKSEPIGSVLSSSDILSKDIYNEQWKVFFKRSDKFKICTEWIEEDDYCNSSKIEYHDFEQSHIVEFSIKPNYKNDTIVDNVFSDKNNIFNLKKPHNSYKRNDDNLRVVREVFPEYFVNSIRDNVLQSYSKNKVNDKNYFYSDKQDYKVEWIKPKDGYGDQGSIVEALEEIISMIEKDEDKYSNASKEYDGDSNNLDSMDSGRVALLNTFIDNRDNYEKEHLYHMNSDPLDSYISIGSKSIYESREWYLDMIQAKLEEDNKKKFKKHINDNIGGNGDKFDSYEELQGTKGNDYKNALGDLGSIGNGQGIQIGLPMNLEHKGTSNYDRWSEDIAFSVDTIPNYFDFDVSEGKWEFNVVNTCWGGPTGIPLLPIPPIPWFCTVNFWTIDIEGKYERFKIVDTLDETHADPLFGHDGQVFLREKNSKITDPFSGNQELGSNTELGFDFWVPSFCIVPPNKLPIGDIEGGLREESKK